MILKTYIPLIYRPIIPKLLEIEFPTEQIASCNTCTLCRSKQSPYISTKCCWYHPHLPNFLLGAILTDKEASFALGKNRLRAQIKAHAGVTPYSIIPPTNYFRLRKETEGQEYWSHSHKLIESLRCPYYENDSCTLYKYRENVCVTFYCSSIGGATGQAFWKNVKRYLKMAETTLAQYAMLQLGWSPAKIKTEAVTTTDFNLEDEQGNINEENYKKLWGDWAGREEEFYIKCFEIVSKVDAETFKRITGLKREILEAAILDTNNEFIKNVLPEKLILHPDVVSENGEEGFTSLRLGEVSARIPTVISPLICGFNGKRTTVEVFHLGYNVLYNMSEVVDELREKGMLIKA